MKRILAFVLVVLMAASILWGCQASGTQSSNTTPSTTELSEERTYEIQLALYDMTVAKLGISLWVPWFVQGYNWGTCYLGSAEGYDFIHYYHFPEPDRRGCTLAECDHGDHSSLPVPVLQVGEVEFYNTYEGNMMAYKDGELYYLTDLFEEGLISEDTLLMLQTSRATCNEEWQGISLEIGEEGHERWKEDGWADYVPPERK